MKFEASYEFRDGVTLLGAILIFALFTYPPDIKLAFATVLFFLLQIGVNALSIYLGRD